MILCVTDSSYAVYEHLAVCSPYIILGRRYSRTYSSNLRVHQGRLLHPVPGTFHRKSLRELLVCPSIDR